MPYISKNNNRREALRKGEPALNAGELNYQMFYYVKHHKNLAENCMYGQIKAYVVNFLGDKPNYQRYNDITGCLIRCAREITRRKLGVNPYILIGILDSYDDEIARYEDTKIISNGDVE